MLQTEFSDANQEYFILASAIIAIAFGLWNLKAVMSV
jgi:hypothetical protein